MKHQSQSTQLPSQKRRIAVVFWIFFLLAIPVMVATIFYSAGYRYDQESRLLTRTAAISVTSTPRSADVKINGVDATEKTPVVQTVPPGSYTIQISKQNYTTWKKTISVTHGQAIVIPDAVLFLEQPREMSVELPIQNTQSSVFERPLEALDIEELQEYEESLKTVGISTADVKLYTEGPMIVLSNTQSNQTYVIQKIDKDQLQKPIDGTITHAQWVNRFTLLYTIGGDMWIYDTRNNSTDLLVRQSQLITSIGVHSNESLYYFTDSEGVYAIERDPRDQRQHWNILKKQNEIIHEVRSNGRILVLKNTETDSFSSYELYEQGFLF